MKLPTLLKKLTPFVTYVSKLRISSRAAGACYFIILSLFPALVLLLGLLRYTGLSVDTLTAMLEGLIPAALLPEVEKVIISTYRATTGTVLSISALTALWSASRGMYGLLTGLNAIYGVSEERGYFHTRGSSVLYTFAFLLVLLLTLVLHVFGTALEKWILTTDLKILARVINLRFFFLLLVQTLLFTLMYMFLPNGRNRFSDSFPGGILSSIGWLTVSHFFSLYVENFSLYSNIYGSVYALALGMLWLYLCLCTLFFGGAVNHFFTEKPENYR